MRDENRRYPEEFAENARKAIRKFLLEHGGETEGGKLLGYSQGQMNRVKPQSPHQPTLRMLIELRTRSGRPLDEILGLPPVPGPPIDSAQARKLRESADFILSTVNAMTTAGPGRASVTARTEGLTAEEFATQEKVQRNLPLTRAIQKDYPGDAKKTREEWRELFARKKEELKPLRRAVAKKPRRVPIPHDHAQPATNKRA